MSVEDVVEDLVTSLRGELDIRGFPNPNDAVRLLEHVKRTRNVTVERWAVSMPLVLPTYPAPVLVLPRNLNWETYEYNVILGVGLALGGSASVYLPSRDGWEEVAFKSRMRDSWEVTSSGSEYFRLAWMLPVELMFSFRSDEELAAHAEVSVADVKTRRKMLDRRFSARRVEALKRIETTRRELSFDRSVLVLLTGSMACIFTALAAILFRPSLIAYCVYLASIMGASALCLAAGFKLVKSYRLTPTVLLKWFKTKIDAVRRVSG